MAHLFWDGPLFGLEFFWASIFSISKSWAKLRPSAMQPQFLAGLVWCIIGSDGVYNYAVSLKGPRPVGLPFEAIHVELGL